MSITSRGWLVQLTDPSDPNTRIMVPIASTEPITAHAAADIAKLKFRIHHGLKSSHELFAKPERALPGARAAVRQCTNDVLGVDANDGNPRYLRCTRTAKEDGLCGKCHYEIAQARAEQVIAE